MFGLAPEIPPEWVGDLLYWLIIVGRIGIVVFPVITTIAIWRHVYALAKLFPKN